MTYPQSFLALRRLSGVAAAMVLLSGLGCAAVGDQEDIPETDGRASAVGDGSLTTLWIHGRSTGGAPDVGNYNDFSYWGDANTPAGINKKAVNWGGVDRISASNGAVRDALDCFCTGQRWCYIAAHSAGNPQIGYALDLYGNTQREIQDGIADSSGKCGSTGGTQVGWNIKWVDIAGGAAGGTELADLGYWAVSDPLTSDLRTATVRSMYDHNDTHGVGFYMFAGAKGTLYSSVLPGQDDEVIAYHSSGGLASTGSFCNPGNWFCDDSLKYSSTGSKKGNITVPKWNQHFVLFRDDQEKKDHYTHGNWGGIVSVAVQDMVDYAK